MLLSIPETILKNTLDITNTVMMKIISEVNRNFIGMIRTKPSVTQVGGEGTCDTFSTKDN